MNINQFQLMESRNYSQLVAFQFKESSMTTDELWEASPCNWCLLQNICFEYCDAKTDWLRIFHGQDTFQDLRDFFRIFPTSSSSTVTISGPCTSSTEIERNKDDSVNSSGQMQGLSRKGKLFRSLRRRVSKGIKSLL